MTMDARKQRILEAIVAIYSTGGGAGGPRLVGRPLLAAQPL